ncbi:MAG: Maf family nucleotide pyrophosphatase [Rhodospirillaceae bacterium]
MPPQLVLASTSAYRRGLLERLRVPFGVVAPGIEESPHGGETPDAMALRLAGEKARAVGATHPGAVVIGSDQVAVLDGAILGKPGTHEAALAQLLACRRRSVVFHTAVCVLDVGGAVEVANVPTRVHYRDYSDAEAQRYLALERPYDCAGSAKIEGLGIVLVERVESTDPTALIGLPLIALVSMLRRAGIPVPA